MTSVPGLQGSVASPERDYAPNPAKLSYIPYQRKKPAARGGTPVTARTISNPSPTKPRAPSGAPPLGFRSSSGQIVKQSVSPFITIASSPSNSDTSGTASPTKVNETSLRSPQLPSSASPPPLRRLVSRSESPSNDDENSHRTNLSPSGSPLKLQLTDGPLRSPSPLKTHVHPHSYAAIAATRDTFQDQSHSGMASPTSHTDKGQRAPYRSGFQPKGVVRHRTDEFVALRAKRRVMTELDDQRMERRLEKLLHIYSQGFEQESGTIASDPSSVWLRRGSMLLDVFSSKKEQEKHRLQQLRRLAEQDVVKWQDDKSHPNCTLCGTPFSLAVRRHHCRLCGHVVCSSPHLPPFLQIPDHASRAEAWEPCSTLMVPDAFHKRLCDMPPRPDLHASPAEQRSYERTELDSIRFCRTCKNTVYRIQFGRHTTELTPLEPLYHKLRTLEEEIHEALPDFHEMLLGFKNMDMKVSSNNRALQADTMQARKELLTSFSRYDQLAKQIVNLAPIVDGRRCSTQKRLQEAVFARANMFLRKHVRPIFSLIQTFASESLPSVKDKADKKEGHNHVRAEVQEQLRILKEQDILLYQYLEAAKKARNLDDVASLKHNQEEIRQEIKRIQMESAHHDADEP